MDKQLLVKLIDCAAGRIPADLVLKNGRIVHVFSGEITTADVAIIDGCIAGIGSYNGDRVVDLDGGYLCPGFIEGHIHIESSMLTPAQFAAAVVPHGTTTVICDPHEIANVCGRAGIDFILEENLPLSIYVMAPSCVPATHMETSGATLSAGDIAAIIQHPRVIGLAEMMNFPGTVAAIPEVIDKLLAARRQELPVDGHAPGLSGTDLQAYIAAGISSEHECSTLAEAREKLRAGMAICIREGSTAKNLEALLPLVNSSASHNCMLVTDDCHADDILRRGHLDHILRRAVQLGGDPVKALQMVTINPARHFGLPRTGAVAPGYQADLVVLEDLDQFAVRQVYRNGRCVADKLSMLTPVPKQHLATFDPTIRSSVKINPEKINLSIPARQGQLRVITCREGSIVTGQQCVEPKVENNLLVSDVDRDILKIAVLERHHGSNSVGLGFVHGFGLREGAFGSTVAHDSHNLIVVGTDDGAMMAVISRITRMGGGMAVVDGKGALGETLPLPVAGLMTTETVQEVSSQMRKLQAALDRMGVLVDNPFMLLSFMALPVIPALKISDKGLVDVSLFQLIPLQDGKKNKK